jgi:hypothetical protein
MKIAIGIPSRGLKLGEKGNFNGLDTEFVNPVWLEHFKKVYNESVKVADIEIIHEHNINRNVSQQRDAIVAKVKADYLWFIDDDIFPPINALEKLLSVKTIFGKTKKLVSGLYWMKQEKDRTCIGYDWWSKERKAVFHLKKSKVNCGFGCGLGCCLIHFTILQRLKLPIFPNFLMVNGAVWGEDNAFFQKAIKFTKLFIKSDVLCDHYDYHTNRFYPEAVMCFQVSGKERLAL